MTRPPFFGSVITPAPVRPAGAGPQPASPAREPYGTTDGQSWRTQGGIGKRFDGTLPANTQQRIAMIAVDGTFGPPQQLTVVLDRTLVLPGVGGNANVVAEVRYGGPGASDTLQVDWVNSTQFSLVASHLYVDAVPVVTFPELPYALPANPALKLGAVVGMGTFAPPRYGATRTVPIYRDATGFTPSTIEVPAFARAMFLQTFYDQYDATAQLTFSAAGFGPGYRRLFNQLFDVTLPLSANDMGNVLLSQTAYPFAAPSARYNLVFVLGL